MKNNIILALLFIAIFSFPSCSPKYYVPNTQNVPLLSDRGNFNATVCGNSNQLEVQGAYALTNHLGIMANGSVFIPKNDDNGNGGKGSLGEVGAGYYMPFLNHLVFEAYGLVGVGNVENHMPTTVDTYPGTTGKINATIMRFGIQPNIGFKTKYFCAAISARISSLNYTNINGNLTFDNQDQVLYLKSNNSHFIAEPALTLRGGIKNVKVQVQLAGSYNLTVSDFLQETSLLSVGLNLNL